MLSPNEVKVLRLVTERGQVTNRTMGRDMEIPTDYAAYLLRYLAKGGYLSKASPGRYRITRMGADALLESLYRVQDLLSLRIRRSLHQREWVNGRIGELKEVNGGHPGSAEEPPRSWKEDRLPILRGNGRERLGA